MLKQLKLIYFHSKEIIRNDILWGLIELGTDISVSDIKVELQEYGESDLEGVAEEIRGKDGVVMQDFSAAMAEVCHREGIRYISWIYDSPQRALYMKEARYDTNYIFHFDQKEIERLKKVGARNLFYSPLAANLRKASGISISEEDMMKFQSEISFVGSLYENKPAENAILKVSSREREGFYRQLEELAFRWDGQSVVGTTDPGLLQSIKDMIDPEDYRAYDFPEGFIEERIVMIPLLAYKERTGMLSYLSQKFSVDLYTKPFAGTPDLGNTRLHPPVDMESEMYKVFYASRINLNVTLKSIEHGVSQRIFDIMSVGGFVLSDYRPDAEELFVPDKELVMCHSLEEMADKAAYYLQHENERMRIGINGYLRVKQDYNYPKLLERMLRITFQDGEEKQ